MQNYPVSQFLSIIWICLLCFLGIQKTHAQDSQHDQIRLIVRVDDMGCSHATNTGIIKTIEEGIATSVEVMVPTPWYPEAVILLQELPDIDVGIHLTLTSEWSNIKWRPLTQVPSLTDERGYFYPMVWKNRLLPGAAIIDQDWDIGEMEKELRAQIEMAKRDIPQLSHVSTHMGCLNINEQTQALMLKLAKEYDLEIFPEDYGTKRFPGLGDNTMPPEKRVAAFIDALHNLTPGNWLFVEHPADDYPEQQAIGHPGYEHVAQDRFGVLKMLTDPRVKKEIEKLGIQLISYADLKS